MITYRIRDWERHFENNRTREMQVMRWVPVPNKHDGEGYQTIMAEPDGIVIYGCWHLILQVASKCLRERGTLLRDDGTPMTARTISLKTGWKREKDIQRALDFLSSSQVGWIEALTTEPAGMPQEGAGKPQEPARNRIEGNGIEENGTEEKRARKRASATSFDELPEWLRTLPGMTAGLWDSWMATRRQKRAANTAHAVGLLVKKLEARQADAVAAVEMAVEAGWTGFEWEWFDRRRGAQPAEHRWPDRPSLGTGGL